eukprot:8802074-Alexandrium_andersonii.AAC.1
MVNAACAGFTPDEPEALQSLRAQRLPARRRGTSATQAAPELGARPWLGHLRREGDIHIFID